ncbi:MAG: glycosyltransferase family 4 protein [Chloroflexi bacterium]|nr:glycosyltransferase family 4 protein [Chloroflexota bacterium]
MVDRVAVVSIAPVLPGAVHGGSQRILDGVLGGLADAGADVRLLCSWRPENDGGFEISPSIRVEPILQLRGFFPDPWESPPHKILQTAEAVRPALEWADAVYLHADTFYLRDLVPAGRRVVRSFHDFHYETALISAFAFRADLTIVPSEYLKDCIGATSGAYHGVEGEPVVVVPNGIDLETYFPRPGVTPRGVRERADGDLVLLWPHRPDLRKGIVEAIEIAAKLTRRLPDRNVRLLVPQHVDAASSADTRAFYDKAVQVAAVEGVMESLEFTPWWSGRETADAYSFADVTLCPGNFIESFSLVAYESLACGTPVAAAGVGALRYLPDHPDVHTFPYGDAAAAAEASLAAAAGMEDFAGIRELLTAKYSFPRMQRAYAAAIMGALPESSQNAPSSVDRFSLAPWCAVAGERIYNDYEYGWSHGPELASFLGSTPDPNFTRASAIDAGLSAHQFESAVRDGTIVRA